LKDNKDFKFIYMCATTNCKTLERYIELNIFVLCKRNTTRIIWSI